jgi:hypothetical protein
LIRAGLALFLLAGGCSSTAFQAYPPPLNLPVQRHRISAGAGIPHLLEYQLSPTGRFDVVAGAGFTRLSIEYEEEVEGRTKTTERLNTLVPMFAGVRYWLTDVDKPGLDVNLFGGPGGATNQSDVWWGMFGGQAGVAVGSYGEDLALAFPLSVGGGMCDGGEYFHLGAEAQLFIRGDPVGGGFRAGAVFGRGRVDVSDGAMWHIPLNLGAFLTIDF